MLIFEEIVKMPECLTPDIIRQVFFVEVIGIHTIYFL